MKPFVILLLLIVFGSLFAFISRPVTLVADAVRSLGHLPERLKVKVQIPSVALPVALRSGKVHQSLHH